MNQQSFFILPIFIVAIFYFVVVRPQNKRAKEMQQALAKLTKGDEVITRGGIIGKITGVADDVLILELQDKVRVRVPRSYIDAKWTGVAPTTTASSTQNAV